jgi:hypothetical protein
MGGCCSVPEEYSYLVGRNLVGKNRDGATLSFSINRNGSFSSAVFGSVVTCTLAARHDYAVCWGDHFFRSCCLPCYKVEFSEPTEQNTIRLTFSSCVAKDTFIVATNDPDINQQQMMFDKKLMEK